MCKLEVSKIKLFSRLFSYPFGRIELDDDEIKWLSEKGWSINPKQDLETIQTEYVRLFVNATPEVTCPPYASVYLEGNLMGESTVEVAELYEKYGLLVNGSELPDHISIELEFLGLLSANLESKPEVKEDYDLMLSHLGDWIISFLERVEQNDKIGYYGHLAKVSKNFLTL